MRRHDERGAIFPLTVVMMGLILVVASLVIDIGGDRVVRRDMQAMADVIALDVARNLNGNPAGSYTGFDASAPSATLLAAAKNESLARQAGAFSTPSEVTIRLAVTDKDTGAFVRWATGTDIPNAVQVWTKAGSAFRFLPTTQSATNIQRSALAVIGPPIACITAGSTFASIQQQNQLDTLLGKLIGVDRLTVLDPYALAALDLEIPLIELAAKLGVGSVKEILTAEVSARDFVLAISEVLPHKGNSANVALLDAIAVGLPDGPNMVIGDILDLDTGGGSGAGVVVNTFSLVQSVIMVANQDRFVDIFTNASFTGLGKVNIQAKVIEAPQIVCGPVGKTARSAQLQLKLTAEVKTLGGLVADADLNPLFITVAEGTGTITNISCTAGSESVTVSANTSTGKLGLTLLTELLLGLTDLVVGVPDPAVKPDGASIGSTTGHTMTFSFPGNDIPPAQTAGVAFGSLGLSSITPIKVTVIGLPVGGVLGSIVIPLLNIIDPLVSNVLRPALASMGVNVGTVQIQAISKPSCNEPFLRG